MICGFQEKCKYKEECKYPHVDKELLKDKNTPTRYATSFRIAIGINVNSFIGVESEHKNKKRFF